MDPEVSEWEAARLERLRQLPAVAYDEKTGAPLVVFEAEVLLFWVHPDATDNRRAHSLAYGLNHLPGLREVSGRKTWERMRATAERARKRHADNG